MAELDVVPKLATLVPHQNEVLETAVLRLLMNLSFEKRLRARMVEVGLLPKLAALLQKESVRACVCVRACVYVCVCVTSCSNTGRPIGSVFCLMLFLLRGWGHSVEFCAACSFFERIADAPPVLWQYHCTSVCLSLFMCAFVQDHEEPHNLASIINILYHISVDDKHKAMFAGTEVIPVVCRYSCEQPCTATATERGVSECVCVRERN